MTLKHAIACFSIFALALIAGGCQGDKPPAPAPEASEQPAAEVTYEPAYPADVSEEGLSAEDAEQQADSQADDHAGDDHDHDHGTDKHTHDGSEDDHQH